MVRDFRPPQPSSALTDENPRSRDGEGMACSRGVSETVLGSMQQSLLDGLLAASTSPRWLILALELAGCHTYFPMWDPEVMMHLFSVGPTNIHFLSPFSYWQCVLHDDSMFPPLKILCCPPKRVCGSRYPVHSCICFVSACHLGPILGSLWTEVIALLYPNT